MPDCCDSAAAEIVNPPRRRHLNGTHSCGDVGRLVAANTRALKGSNGDTNDPITINGLRQIACYGILGMGARRASENKTQLNPTDLGLRNWRKSKTPL